MATLTFCLYVFLLILAVATVRGHPSAPRWLARVIRAHWPPSEWARATCIAWHESRYRPRTVSKTGDYGLWQINRATWDPAWNPRAARVVGQVRWERIYEPDVNARVAARIWRHLGWRPWTTRGLC
jgi:hypothetical protein